MVFRNSTMLLQIRLIVPLIVVLVGLLSSTTIYARIHHLNLIDDRREQVTISTFGFLKNGFLQVKVNKLSFDPFIKLESIRNSFAFILEKNQNRGFSSFSAKSKNQDFCSLIKRFNQIKKSSEATNTSSSWLSMPDDQAIFDRGFLEANSEFFRFDPLQNYSLLIVHPDLVKSKANVTRIGKDLHNLRVISDFSKNLYGFYGQQKTTTETATVALASLVPTTTENAAAAAAIREENELNKLIKQKGALMKMLEVKLDEKNESISFKFEVDFTSASEEGLYFLNFYNCFQPNILDKYDESMLKSSIDSRNKTAHAGNSDSNGQVVIDISENYFIERSQVDFHYGVTLDIELIERNEDSYLSAGELPVPTLYLTWSIIYFLAGISWMYILKSSKGEVHKIHYLMLGLVFIKSITLTFHAINMHYIAINGRHEAIWAILYYITYVLRGLLLIISILLVGTGWTFIKHVLSENERRLFVIIIPLQILAITSYIFLEEKEEGDAVYVTWRQLFFLLDLVCCGAILFPVVWSIRHLEAASKTDGKMAINLRKLRIFKHFYIMVIFYIYFTRIIGFLLKQILPFRYEWFDELVTEIVTFVFFVMTAYKFQPAVNNPYLQLAQQDEDDDGSSEMAMLAASQDLQMESVVINEAADTNDQTVFDLKDYSTKRSATIANGVAGSKGLLDANNVVSRAAKQQQSRV